MTSWSIGSQNTQNTNISVSGEALIYDGQNWVPLVAPDTEDFELSADTLICPMCSIHVPIAQAIERKHHSRGLDIIFKVCPGCVDRSLCPADYHGIHSEIVEHDRPGVSSAEMLGHCSACRQEFVWRNGWQDVDPPPEVAAISALNGRLQRGEIDMDSYLELIRPWVGVEGPTGYADGEGDDPKET